MSAVLKEIQTIEVDGKSFVKNNKGHLVPVDQLDDLDVFRHEFVMEIAERAMKLRDDQKYLLDAAFNGIRDLANITGEKHDIELVGAKGNATLMSIDGLFKLTLSASGVVVLDERMLIVKETLSSCIKRFSIGGSDNLRKIFESAFKESAPGMISIAKLRILRDAKVDDDEWKCGINLLNDILKPSRYRQYINVYQLVDGKYELIDTRAGSRDVQ